MPIVDTQTEAPHLFKAGAYPAEKLRIIRFEGSEGLSEVFRFSLDLASSDQKVEFDQVVGQPALLTARGTQGIRHLHGLVSLFEHMGKEGKWALYRAEVVPAVWKLSLRASCRIFQDKTIPDIIKQVLLEGGLTANQFRFALNMGRYKARTYCVQYGETDLNFISRLMEQYGIWYYFEHSETNHVLVMGDDPSAYAMPSGASSILYHAPATAGVPGVEHISDFRYHRQIRCGAVKLKDFDFEKPRLNITGDAQARSDTKLEEYDYLGECRDGSERAPLAKVRLEEAQAIRQLGSGRSDCCRLIPGYRFTLEQCHRSDLNREYLTVKATHKGKQPQVLGAETAANVPNEPSYQNEFECIPSDVPFRPACMTPRPRIEGPQTAIVVGPAGEEIYTDKHGRVKVQFHWDREGARDEKSSCWVRVAQLWAGASWGAMFIPRIGQEVLVEFLEGDPDQPIITGRVYNGDNMPPYPLPSEKTKSTIKSNSSAGGGGSNEIRFEDGKGSEEIYLHGQKDWTIAIKNDKNQTVGHDESLAVTNNRTKTVGVDQSETVGANKSVKVGANHTESIGGAEAITVGMASAHTTVLARALTVGGAYQVSVGAAMNETVGGAKAEEIGGAKTVVVGALSSENVAKNKSVDVGDSITESAGKNIGVTAGDNVTISAGKNMVLDAGDQLTIKTGSASITMKSNGDIVIKGGKITINASGDLALKGSQITQN